MLLMFRSYHDPHAEGPAQALLRALSGLPPPYDDECYEIIQEAPSHFDLRDIALLLIQAARNDAGLLPIAEIRGLLEQRIENFCLCLNLDDAKEFQRILSEELDTRFQ